MGTMRWLAAGLVAAGALAGAAAAAGPWPGLAASVDSQAGVRYSTAAAGGATTVRAWRGGEVVRSARVDGVWGVPAVTLNGAGGGLSRGGRLLVLSQPPSFTSLRTRTTFLVLSAPSLAVRSRVVLRGDFGFDALSPDGRTLYLIQHVSMSPIHYAVRAYDLRAKRLVPGAIVDKREADEKMTGYPVARTMSRVGTWVYTLYTRPEGEPFVHALNASKRTAFCIDVPWSGRTDDVWKARLRLADAERRLDVVLRGDAVARIDTRSMRVG